MGVSHILQLCLQRRNHFVAFLQQGDQVVSNGIDILIVS